MKFAINSGKIKRFYKRIKDLSTTVDAGILKENKRKEKKNRTIFKTVRSG